MNKRCALVMMLVLGSAQAKAQTKATPADASVMNAAPTCRLGTAWAVNPFRKLAPGEYIVRAEGGVAYVSQRESVGSSHIVLRRCFVPAGTEIVVGGLSPWIKECGNALDQLEGWIIPGYPARGEKGDKGDKGDTGARGATGPRGSPGVAGGNYEPSPPPPHVRGRGVPCFRGKTGESIFCAVLAGTAAYFIFHHSKEDKSGPPKVTSDSVVKGPVVGGDSAVVHRCEATSYPNNCPAGLRASVTSFVEANNGAMPLVDFDRAEKRVKVGISLPTNILKGHPHKERMY